MLYIFVRDWKYKNEGKSSSVLASVTEAVGM